jgi:hypothetical protein
MACSGHRSHVSARKQLGPLRLYARRVQGLAVFVRAFLPLVAGPGTGG